MKNLAVFLLIFGSVFTGTQQTMAQTMCDGGPVNIEKPLNRVTSNMGPRKTRINGASSNHKGTDYSTRDYGGVGTPAKGPPEGCVNVYGGKKTPYVRGYGNIAKFDCGNGITIQYAHLDGADAYDPNTNQVRTGDTGVGVAHLDYIIAHNGKTLDAQCIVGTVDNSKGAYFYGDSVKKYFRDDIVNPDLNQCPMGGKIDICDADNIAALREQSDRARGAGASSVTSGPTAGTLIAGTGSSSGAGSTVIQPYYPPTSPSSSGIVSRPTNCSGSTCIETQMIATAQGTFVRSSKAKSYKEFWSHDATQCQPPTKTNVDVLRQRANNDGIGYIEEYEDAFCLNQGCTYIKPKGNAKIGECKK